MDSYKVARMDDGVIRIVYFEKHITFKHFKEVFDQVGGLVDGRALFLISGHRVCYVDYDVLKFTRSPEYAARVRAQALITETTVERLLGKLYMKTHSTNYLNQCFCHEYTALEWLKSVK